MNMEEDKSCFIPKTPQEVIYEEEKYSINKLRLNGKALLSYVNGLDSWKKSSIIEKKGRMERELLQQLARNRLERMGILEREALLNE